MTGRVTLTERDPIRSDEERDLRMTAGRTLATGGSESTAMASFSSIVATAITKSWIKN
jgi:hypothetical protein